MTMELGYYSKLVITWGAVIGMLNYGVESNNTRGCSVHEIFVHFTSWKHSNRGHSTERRTKTGVKQEHGNDNRP